MRRRALDADPHVMYMSYPRHTDRHTDRHTSRVYQFLATVRLSLDTIDEWANEIQ